MLAKGRIDLLASVTPRHVVSTFLISSFSELKAQLASVCRKHICAQQNHKRSVLDIAIRKVCVSNACWGNKLPNSRLKLEFFEMGEWKHKCSTPNGSISGPKRPRYGSSDTYRRMVFNVVGKNCDDHTKNISFRLRQGQRWELAPAYDISYTHNPKGEWTQQHLMSINGRFKDFTRSDLLQLSNRFGIGSASTVIDQVVSSIAQWPKFAAQAGVKKDLADEIAEFHLLRLGGG